MYSDKVSARFSQRGAIGNFICDAASKKFQVKLPRCCEGVQIFKRGSLIRFSTAFSRDLL